VRKEALSVGAKYYIRDLSCDIISYGAWSCYMGQKNCKS